MVVVTFRPFYPSPHVLLTGWKNDFQNIPKRKQMVLRQSLILLMCTKKLE